MGDALNQLEQRLAAVEKELAGLRQRLDSSPGAETTAPMGPPSSARSRLPKRT